MDDRSIRNLLMPVLRAKQGELRHELPPDSIDRMVAAYKVGMVTDGKIYSRVRDEVERIVQDSYEWLPDGVYPI